VTKAWAEPLKALDAWFLYLERPEAPLHIGGVYVFEGRPSLKGGVGAQGIAETLASRLHLVPRYRQKVRWLPLNVGHPVWVDDADFDLSYHVRRAALPRPGTDAQLAEYAARVFARPLDLSKPLWELTVVEGLKGNRVGVINKVHHAMVDGISAVDLGTLLFDLDPDNAVQPMPAPPWEPRPEPSTAELLTDELRGLIDPASAARNLVSGGVGGLVRGAVDAVFRSPWGGAAQLALSPFRPGSRLFFNRQIGPSRRVAHVDLPLEDVKLVKETFGGTVNDVLLAITADALRRFLDGRGETVPDHVRAFCPVSIRGDSERYRLGNLVSGMLVDLPTAPMPPLTRLSRISHTTGDLKRSRQAVAARQLTEIGYWAPATLQVAAARLIASQPPWSPQSTVNLVITNVPGPQVPFYTGGARMLDVWPFVPVYHLLGLGIALFSYAGRVHFGLLADRDLVPDVDSLAHEIAEASADYRSLALRLAKPARPRRASAAKRSAAESEASPSAPARAAGGRRSSRPRG
jgi:diacylglycerol O-acyltransferase / wax synthase